MIPAYTPSVRPCAKRVYPTATRTQISLLPLCCLMARAGLHDRQPKRKEKSKKRETDHVIRATSTLQIHIIRMTRYTDRATKTKQQE